MENRRDILFDETGDLACLDGDFLLGASDDQHVEDILFASPGTYKQAPFIGVSVMDAVNGALTGELKNKINVNLEADGYKTSYVGVDGDNEQVNPHELTINLNYELK